VTVVEAGLRLQDPRPSLLANENVPAPLVRMLRDSGLDVAYVAETIPAATDRDVLAHAVATGRWILTFDRDYGELVFARLVLPPESIIFLRQAPWNLREYADVVLGLMSRSGEVAGHLAVVDGRQVRLRPLPSMSTPAAKAGG
jgi:predicted nuclease of predicted toxin-antitoxin system